MTQDLSSWHGSPARDAILSFIERVTREGSSDYVDPSLRVAVFDNDGTLWCEKPMPVQGDFFMRRLGEVAQEDPSLRDQLPWKAVVEKNYSWFEGVITKHYHGDDTDLKVLARGLLQAFAGKSIEEYERAAKEFFAKGRHPTLNRSYLECAYQPMIELLALLAKADFTSYIASGGGRDFMRAVTLDMYGVPLDHVIGSSVALAYRDGPERGDVFLNPQIDIFDDGPTKPVRIWSRVGKRPILACGNSNGDIPMLKFLARPPLPSLGILIDHDDEKREFAYRAGAETALELARKLGWTVVSMKDHWKTIFSKGTSDETKKVESKSAA